jgi:hypothetical protein
MEAGTDLPSAKRSWPGLFCSPVHSWAARRSLVPVHIIFSPLGMFVNYYNRSYYEKIRLKYICRLSISTIII